MTRQIRSRRTLGLFWKVYLYLIILLALIAITLAVAGHFLGRTQSGHQFHTRIENYLHEIANDLDQPRLIERDFRREQILWGVSLTLYRRDGTLIASCAQPPFPPLQKEEIEKLSQGITRIPSKSILAMPVNKNGQLVAYLIADGFPLSQHLTRVAGILGIILISLAVGSIPLVRGITSPLEKLTQIAQRLGNGDLSVRSNIRQNDEVGRLAFALDEMADRLDKLLRGEKELLANISHELRTPLARIRVALEIAAEGDIERTRRYLSEIEKDLGEVEQLIEDIFTMTRLDLIGGKQGALPLRFSLISVHSLIERASQRFRTNHPLRNLQESEESIDASLSVQADEMLMRRAIDNLLENAQKYSEIDQPIVLATRLEQADHTKPQVIIEIRDRGIGIPLEEQSNLFRPFYRTEHSRARNSGGVGLGLALAKKIVEAHQGGIEVHSQPGMGTSMRIWLPIQKTL